MGELPKNFCIYLGLDQKAGEADGIGNTVRAYGFVDPNATMHARTFAEAGRAPEEALSLAVDGLMVPYSAGNLITREAVEREMYPKVAIGLNPPEPTTKAGLLVGGAIRSGRHLTLGLNGPKDEQAENLAIAGDMRQSLTDWSGNLGRLSEISTFSGNYWLGALAAKGVLVAAFVSGADEFWRFRKSGIAPRVRRAFDASACHDTSMLEPVRVVAQIAALEYLPRRKLDAS